MVNVLLVVATLLLLAVDTQAVRPRPSSDEYAQMFSRWMTARNRSYSADHLTSKFSTYKSNYDYVEDHNERFTQGLESFQMALNEHADLTSDEFRSRLGYVAPTVAALPNDIASFDLPSSFELPSGSQTIINQVKNSIFDGLCQRFNILCPSRPDVSSTGVAPVIPPVVQSSSASVPALPSSSAAPAVPSSSASVIAPSSTGQAVASSSARPFERSSSSAAVARSSSSSVARAVSSSATPTVRSSSASTPAAPSSTGSPAPDSTSLDWRTYGYVGPIKDQGSCGSCWSFASTGVMEGAWAKKTGSLLSFSEQELLDCVANGQRTCATGGNLHDVWTWLLGSSGTTATSAARSPMSEASYPYTASSAASCAYNAASATSAKFTSNVRVSSTEAALLAAVQTTPVGVAVHSSSRAFQFYSSGVLSDSSCLSTNLDHAVLIIGYGTDSTTGYDYWLVKNSWGTSWGDNGYLKIRRNYNNMCGLLNDATYIVA